LIPLNVCGLVLLLALLAGCTPAGPRALIEGKRLVDAGKYPEAIETLKTATTLLGGTNALAWNYLGVAYQHAGELAEAERAYNKALSLNRGLDEVHFNLGCLWLAENKLEAAKVEFTACTMRQPNAVEGFLRLGAVQLRTHDPSAADRTFNDALRISPQNPEALNGLGLARLQRGRATEAAQCFDGALKQQPDYRPALLNLAIVAQQYQKDRQLALDKYREYLALKPTPPNADVLAATVRQLEQELNPPGRHAATNAVAQPSANVNPPKPVVTNVARAANAPKPEPTATPPRQVTANPGFSSAAAGERRSGEVGSAAGTQSGAGCCAGPGFRARFAGGAFDYHFNHANRCYGTASRQARLPAKRQPAESVSQRRADPGAADPAGTRNRVGGTRAGAAGASRNRAGAHSAAALAQGTAGSLRLSVSGQACCRESRRRRAFVYARGAGAAGAPAVRNGAVLSFGHPGGPELLRGVLQSGFGGHRSRPPVGCAGGV
jgi:Flp pilus assembly protein TadD